MAHGFLTEYAFCLELELALAIGLPAVDFDTLVLSSLQPWFFRASCCRGCPWSKEQKRTYNYLTEGVGIVSTGITELP